MRHKKFQCLQPYHGPSFVLNYVVQFSDKNIQYAGHFWQTDVLYNLTICVSLEAICINCQVLVTPFMILHNFQHIHVHCAPSAVFRH